MSADLDSILEYAGGYEGRLSDFGHNRRTVGVYPTTGGRYLDGPRPGRRQAPENEGLRTVLNACDGLEAQVSGLRGTRDGASADVSS